MTTSITEIEHHNRNPGPNFSGRNCVEFSVKFMAPQRLAQRKAELHGVLSGNKEAKRLGLGGDFL